MKFVNDMFGTLLRVVKQPLESFIDLETADSPSEPGRPSYSLVARDGSLVTVVRIDGSRTLVGDLEYRQIVAEASLKLGSRFDRQGHAMQIVFIRNPDRAESELRNLIRPSEVAARAIGLDLNDLFTERRRNLARWTAWEETYFVLWTRPAVLSKRAAEAAAKDQRAQKWVVAARAQFPYAGIKALRTYHAAFSSSILQGLEELGIQAKALPVHDALRVIRGSLYPARQHDQWRANLPGDPIVPRAPEYANDLSDVLWPSLPRQLCTADAEVINDSTVRIDNLIWTGLDMTLAPSEPTPFPMLLQRLVEANVPFRISFLIESGGIHGAAMKKFAASVLSFSNSSNKEIKNSLDALAVIARNEPVVKLRINVASWAAHDELRVLEERGSILQQAVESWGYAQLSHQSGDPLQAVLSSAVGIACSSTAPAAIAPLHEVMKLLPWQRASSPFEKGAILFRTPDGKIWPYQTGTNLTTTWFDLIFAQPGAGKSVLMNSLSLGTCLTPGNARLPYIAIIDIGPSSSGLIALLKDSLPPERRHEVAHYRLRMTSEYAVNPFDTQLGCRYPTVDERSFLVELLTLLCTPPGQSAPYDGIPQLAGLVVDEMYRWRDDAVANAEPRPYLPHVDHDVDAAMRTYDIRLPEEPLWWDVVEACYERDLVHEANLAQRHCAPTLSDAVTAARRPQIRSLLEQTKIGAGSEGVLHAFERMITSSIREFPILASITRFDIATSRICALDLGDVAPQGDDTADRQTAIMYMLARQTLVRHWWLNADVIRTMPEKFRPYHEARLRDIRETPKRLCFDEFHRTSRSNSVRSQVIRDVREGRKWGVQIVLSSQLLGDFSKDMIDLATGVWVLGAAVSQGSVDDTRERFGLSDAATFVIRMRLTGPKASGAPALFVLATNEGRYEQWLINTLGPIELWALSTSAEDVQIRDRLYSRLGGGPARRLLSAAYPGGSARSEIRRRVQMRVERGELETGAISSVIEEIVNELMESVNPAARMRQAAE